MMKTWRKIGIRMIVLGMNRFKNQLILWVSKGLANMTNMIVRRGLLLHRTDHICPYRVMETNKYMTCKEALRHWLAP